jgi:hypothetical protein
MKMFLVLCLFLTAGNIFAGGRRAASNSASQLSQSSQPALDEHETPDLTAILPAPDNEPSRAEQVMKALAAAHPRRIERAEFRNGDWAVLLRGTWYYYAGGKLLPENLLEDAANYNPQPFYSYQSELPPWKAPAPREAARFRDMTNNRSRNQPRRSPHFYDDLWRMHNDNEAYQRVKSIRFLGRSIMVHYAIMEDLSLVEELILELAKTDPRVQSWINNINVVDAWNWRNIADTQTRSFHAYGLAIDILPKSLGGKETYWLWAAGRNLEWWNIPYNGRFHPPDAVIKAFESYGFIWGGKWLLFDTMHFEYRPEILILSGMKLETLR